MLAALLAGIAVGISLVALRLALANRTIIYVQTAPITGKGPSLPPFINSQIYRSEVPSEN